MSICIHKQDISKEVKDFSNGEILYTNTFHYCNKLKRRIGQTTCVKCTQKTYLNNNKQSQTNG